MTAANWLTLTVAAVTFIGTWLTLRAQRARIAAENTTDLTATALSLIAPLEARIGDLETQLVEERDARSGLDVELREQRKRRYELEARVLKLEQFLRAEGYDPVNI